MVNGGSLKQSFQFRLDLKWLIGHMPLKPFHFLCACYLFWGWKAEQSFIVSTFRSKTRTDKRRNDPSAGMLVKMPTNCLFPLNLQLNKHKLKPSWYLLGAKNLYLLKQPQNSIKSTADAGKGKKEGTAGPEIKMSCRQQKWR